LKRHNIIFQADDFGDQVLTAFGQDLQKMLRAQDIVARWGGEEFIALLPETDAVGAKHVAGKIRKGIEAAQHRFKGGAVPITATLGVSIFDGSAAIADCIKIADDALYEGKSNGRNRVVLATDDRPNRVLKRH
jgi:diguanylate cyclase (GGDEF)-like protein